MTGHQLALSVVNLKMEHFVNPAQFAERGMLDAVFFAGAPGRPPDRDDMTTVTVVGLTAGKYSGGRS